MPARNTLNLSNLNILQAEKEEIEKFINNNDKIKNKVDKIKKILTEKFYLTDVEVQNYILKICEMKASSDVEKFEEIFEAFEKNYVDPVDANERVLQARNIVDDVYDLYRSETRRIGNEFVKCIAEAKKFGLDPFRFAIKTNIEKSVYDVAAKRQGVEITKLSMSLDALTAKYYARYFKTNLSEKEEQLFSHDETKELLNQCMTLATHLNNVMVEYVLLALSDLAYDKKKGVFYADVREFIRKAPSILLANPVKMYATISNLQTYYNKMGKTQEDLVQRVLQSPSVLCADSNYIDSTINLLSENYQSLISQLPEKVKRGKDARAMAEAFAYDVTNLSNLSQIKSLTTESLKNMQDILVRYLGAENALTCFQNMEILNKAPELVEYALAVISTSSNSKELREKFIKSPNTFLEETKDFSQNDDNKDGQGTERKTFFANKEALPDVKLSKEEIEDLKSKVSKKDLKTVREKIDAQRSRLQELKRQQEEEKRRRREEEKANKISKTQRRKLRGREERLEDNHEPDHLEKKDETKEERSPIEHFLKICNRDKRYKNSNVDKFVTTYKPLVDFLRKEEIDLDLPSFDLVKSVVERTEKLIRKGGNISKLSMAIGQEFTKFVQAFAEDQEVLLGKNQEKKAEFNQSFRNNVELKFGQLIAGSTFNCKSSDCLEIKLSSYIAFAECESRDCLAKSKDLIDLIGMEGKSRDNFSSNIMDTGVFIHNYMQGVEEKVKEIVGNENLEKYFTDKVREERKNIIDNFSTCNIQSANSPIAMYLSYVHTGLEFFSGLLGEYIQDGEDFITSIDEEKDGSLADFEIESRKVRLKTENEMLLVKKNMIDKLYEFGEELPNPVNVLVLPSDCKSFDRWKQTGSIKDLPETCDLAVFDGFVTSNIDTGEEKKLFSITKNLPPPAFFAFFKNEFVLYNHMNEEDVAIMELYGDSLAGTGLGTGDGSSGNPSLPPIE